MEWKKKTLLVFRSILQRSMLLIMFVLQLENVLPLVQSIIQSLLVNSKLLRMRSDRWSISSCTHPAEVQAVLCWGRSISYCYFRLKHCHFNSIYTIQNVKKQTYYYCCTYIFVWRNEPISQKCTFLPLSVHEGDRYVFRMNCTDSLYGRVGTVIT